MVAAENDALANAKVGGVADVIRDAPRALAAQGVTVDVVIPDYGFELGERHFLGEITVAFNSAPYVLSLFEIPQAQTGVKQIVISHPLLSQSQSIYCNDTGDRPFATDATKFALFNAAVCEALKQGKLTQPTILHLHDWHSACVAVLLKFDPRYCELKKLRLVYTVHNLALQGIRPFKGDESSLEAWFPSLNYDGQLLCDPRYPHCFNPMRSAINLADKVHVVSPSYSQEVQIASNEAHGFFGGEGLEKDLQQASQQGKLIGILNGCDYTLQKHTNITNSQLFAQIEATLFSWMVKSEQLQTSHYIAHQRVLQFRAQNTKGPLVTSVGRLTEQKVLLLCQRHNEELTIDGVCQIINQFNGRLIIIGSGDTKLEQLFTSAMARNNNLLFLKGYGQDIGDSMYQLGDLFLMPSSFEPCGISQMLAMRAGQPCLVHSVGGLKDTVEHNVNGFCFKGQTLTEQSDALLNSLKEALTIMQKKPDQWQKIRACAKKTRFSWSHSVLQYMAQLYK